jgi:hypothetical protein
MYLYEYNHIKKEVSLPHPVLSLIFYSIDTERSTVGYFEIFQLNSIKYIFKILYGL